MTRSGSYSQPFETKKRAWFLLCISWFDSREQFRGVYRIEDLGGDPAQFLTANDPERAGKDLESRRRRDIGKDGGGHAVLNPPIKIVG